MGFPLSRFVWSVERRAISRLGYVQVSGESLYTAIATHQLFDRRSMSLGSNRDSFRFARLIRSIFT